jgi:parallel beta-helix repeat protein
MKRKNLLRIAMLLLSIFIISEVNIFATAKAIQTCVTVVSSDNPNNMIIVDKNGEEDYKSIQEAIDNAVEDSTIYVKIGIYSEIININKRISLMGQDKEKTIISPISEENKYAIYIAKSGVTISSITVKNGGDGLYTMGIKIAAPQTSIKDCRIADVPVGIGIWSSYNIISNCTFWRCRDEGIALLGSSFSECNNNKITGCEFYENCDGIELQYSSNNVISYCSFYNNTHSGIDAIASSNNNNTISNCEIYNNAVHGIYLSRSVYNQIIDCTVSNNKDGNIIMTEGSLDNEIKDQEPKESYVKNLRSILQRLISFLSSFYGKN